MNWNANANFSIPNKPSFGSYISITYANFSMLKVSKSIANTNVSTYPKKCANVHKYQSERTSVVHKTA